MLSSTFDANYNVVDDSSLLETATTPATEPALQGLLNPQHQLAITDTTSNIVVQSTNAAIPRAPLSNTLSNNAQADLLFVSEDQLADWEASPVSNRDSLIGYNNVSIYAGHQYVLTNGYKTWEEAQAEAESIGGNLVTINNAAEDQWLRENFGGDEGFWMGLSDRTSEGNFQWASGEAVTYTNWAPGEPNDFNGNQDYGRINFAGDKWDDEYAYTTLQGIIEINNTPAAPLESNDTAITYNGSQYLLLNDYASWEEAQAQAQQLGGNLVTINDASEDQWLKQTFGQGESYWMGMSDRDQEGTFRWASGEAVTYTNWAPGEPNDWEGTQDYGRTNFGNNKQWDDDHFYSNYRGLVEIKLDGGNQQPTPPQTPSKIEAPTSPTVDNAITRNGSQYQLLDESLTWEEAQAQAQQLGGNLVTINDASEDQWLKQTFGQDENFWMGLSDRDQEGTFRWASGEAVTYTNWAPGEPNDWEGTQDYGRTNFGGNKQWDDDHFYSRLRSIVEIKLDTPDENNNPPVDPPIIDQGTQNPSEPVPVEVTYNGSKYQLLSKTQTWEEAQAEARALGGNLVTINDAAEDRWLRETFGRDEGFWMGLSDRTSEGNFQWASGEAVTYTNWAPGEPNDFNGNQDYGRINFAGDKWDDEFAYTRLQGIVEIKLDGSVALPPNPIVDGGDNGGNSNDDVYSIYDDAFSRSVPDDYSGYNTNAVEISDWSDKNGIRALAQAVNGINAQTLRIPGGDTANFWNWDIGGVIQDRTPWTYPYFLPEQLPLALNYEFGTTASLENMKPLFDQTGAEPIWVVNMLTSDLATEIRHLQEAKALGYAVNKIELGNELYFGIPNYARPDYGGQAPQVGGFPSAADYAAAAKEWAIAIKSAVGLENTTIAAIGVSPEHVPEQRGVEWMPALLQKTGPDNRSVIDVVDAITLHPYYSTDSTGATKSDVGNSSRAGEIARKGIASLRDTLADPALNVAGLQNEDLWITEHNIIEDAVVVLGGTWLQALLLDFHTQEFLKDPRTTVSTAHLLTGNAQWQALTDENGLQIDGSQRGRADRPFKTDASQAYQPTAMGMLLGKSAEIFDEGTATLLASSEAFIAWQVENSVKEISATNAHDRTEALILPEGETWEVVTYTANPWATFLGESELTTRVQTLSGGDTLTIDGFTKVIARAK